MLDVCDDVCNLPWWVPFTLDDVNDEKIITFYVNGEKKALLKDCGFGYGYL